MNHRLETQIIAAEAQLRQAMLDSNVSVLNELLAPDLLFTNHLGQLVTKQDDLAAHRSGMVQIQTLTPSETQMQWIEEVAIVSVQVHIGGRYADAPFEEDLRFTRVWARAASGTWQVMAAHASVVALAGLGHGTEAMGTV